jgi:hypothetical protein
VETNAAQQRIARLTGWMLAGLFAAIFCTAAPVHAQAPSTSSSDTQNTPDEPVAHGTIAIAAPVTYDNRFEIFGGLNYMGFKAGPYLTQNMNMGGAEVMGTYWLRNGAGRYIKPNVLGLVADYRFDAGTTPVQVNPVGLNRTLVYQDILMGGVQVRGPRNEFAALSAHVLGGVSWANFSHGTSPTPPTRVGLYSDGSAFMGAIGASVDINQSKHFAVRLSPDLMLSHFGTYTDTRFAISGGILYRFDHFKFKK